MNGRPPTFLLVPVLAAAAACGGLAVPDLGTGRVEGRLTGAAPGAYVYALGAPDRFASVAADGSFAIERVPAGSQQLVFFDGASRAELGAVEVQGGMRNRLADRDAAKMPLAGRIVAAARPSGGATPGARFTVEGTVLRDLSAGPLGPLPAGTWTLAARMGGFRTLLSPISVREGLPTDAELPLEIDEADQHRGCLSTTCPNGLHCDATDGRCYACTATSDCGAGGSCDPATHTCVAGAADGELCESASAPGQCASGRMVAGSPYGYCSSACAGPADCPAGWSCDGAAGLCTVPLTCRDLRVTFGSPCVHDDACAAALSGGFCLRQEEEAGFCTAPCAGEASCTAAGYGHCRASPGGKPDSCQP